MSCGILTNTFKPFPEGEIKTEIDAYEDTYTTGDININNTELRQLLQDKEDGIKGKVRIQLSPPEYVQFKSNASQDQDDFFKFGMMNMNEMIRPLGYEEGGDVGSFAEQRSLLDRISNFFKYQRRDPERFFGEQLGHTGNFRQQCVVLLSGQQGL